MHSLFLRIFVLFLIAMALIVGASIAVTYAVAAREVESQELQRRPNIAIQASEVLDSGGLPALRRWLDVNKGAIGEHELFIVGPDGKDILGRRLSESALRRMEIFNRAMSDVSIERRLGEGGRPTMPRNFRPPRYAPQIVGLDGTPYTVLLMLRRPSIFGALSLPGIWLAILSIALAVSALTSWWLAQHLSAPIRRIQTGARSLAGEQIGAAESTARVSEGLEDRKDELAELARDFDAMADQLRAKRAAVTQLLRDISHELRSPLARMRLAVGLARQPGADLPRQFDRLEQEIERLDALISQVLKLARLAGTQLPFEREAFDIDEVLEPIVRDANFEGAAKNCCVLLTGARHATLRGSRDLLSSAIENVLRNAVRYSPSDAPIDVSVDGAAAGGVSITVRDRGPGVPPADLERIFEPFYRVAASRDRATGGEGIGLAITSQVLKTHGGSATAANHAGGGLEVRLFLPRAHPLVAA